jgi:hypothetical protein
MKRFIPVLNDGSFINIPATRMEISEDAIIAYNGSDVVAYADIGFALAARIEDRKDDCNG